MKVKKFACIALDITYPTGFGLGVEIDGNETEKILCLWNCCRLNKSIARKNGYSQFLGLVKTMEMYG